MDNNLSLNIYRIYTVFCGQVMLYRDNPYNTVAMTHM